MDPVSLILTALAAGASSAMKDTATKAVQDSYEGLKSLLARTFAGRRGTADLVEQTDRAPEVWREPLEQRLSESAAELEELVRAAQRVLVEADPAGASEGKYTVSVTGGKGVVVGDQASVTMRFDDRDD